MKAVLLGATRGMGRSLARLLAERGDELFLLGRDLEQVERSATDLQARAGDERHIGTALCDLEKPETFVPALDVAEAFLGEIEVVIVTAGLFGTQEALEEDLDFTRRMLTVNLAHTILFCEHARQRLMKQPNGRLVVFSSVAGDRGRKPVILYGASKAGLSHYLEGLDHRYRAEGLVTINVKPGFIKTGMTQGLKPPPFAGDPDEVAKDVLKAIQVGNPVVYTPWPWGWIMLIIKHLPRMVMRRIGF